MEVLGKIKELGETMTVGSAGTFKKRTIVVSTNEQYVQHIPIDFVQDKTSILDSYKIGDSVVVGINIRGNEYNGKYYVSLNGWKINKQDNLKQSPEPKENIQVQKVEEEISDLPFN